VLDCPGTPSHDRPGRTSLSEPTTGAGADERAAADARRARPARRHVESFGVSEPGPGREAFLSTGPRVRGRSAARVRTMAGIHERILRLVEREPRPRLRRRASLTRTQKIGVMARAWLPG
jgi:hypothetical protein